MQRRSCLLHMLCITEDPEVITAAKLFKLLEDAPICLVLTST